MPPTLDKLETIFQNLVTSLLALGGIILLIMLLSSGLKYLTSGGDPKAAEGAKNALTYAIGGLVLLVGSYLLLLIIETTTGAKVTVFQIVKP